MQKNVANKALGEEAVETKAAVEKYYFPEYEVTVEASSYEEAVEKVKKLTNK